jgi:PAS domain S-box-containing protein
MTRKNQLPGAFDIGLRSLLVVPLISKDQVIGALHFRSLKQDAYSEQDAKLGESIASQISGAITNAQLFAERKRAEEALRDSEAKYRHLHETMMDAFISVDMTGRIQEANRAFQAMLDYSEEELRQLTYMDLTPEKWHALEESIVEEHVLTQGYSKVYEKEYRKRNGTIFPVEMRTSLMRDDTGKPVGM